MTQGFYGARDPAAKHEPVVGAGTNRLLGLTEQLPVPSNARDENALRSIVYDPTLSYPVRLKVATLLIELLTPAEIGTVTVR